MLCYSHSAPMCARLPTGLRFAYSRKLETERLARCKRNTACARLCSVVMLVEKDVRVLPAFSSEWLQGLNALASALTGSSGSAAHVGSTSSGIFQDFSIRRWLSQKQVEHFGQPHPPRWCVPSTNDSRISRSSKSLTNVTYYLRW